MALVEIGQPGAAQEGKWPILHETAHSENKMVVLPAGMQAKVKEIAKWVEKLFEAKVEPKAMAVRAGRMEKKIGTNVPNPIPTNPTDKFVKNLLDEQEEDPEWQEPIFSLVSLGRVVPAAQAIG